MESVNVYHSLRWSLTTKYNLNGQVLENVDNLPIRYIFKHLNDS